MKPESYSMSNQTTDNHMHPGFFARMRALIRGEISAETIESYRAAGGLAYSCFVEAEKKRADLADGGTSPWTMSAGDRAYFTAVWIGFSLQTLGDAFIKADYDLDPGTAGFVPPITAQQVDMFYSHVAEFLAFAAAAADSKDYVLPVHLPFDLPEFVEADPCPLAHLVAMLAAGLVMVEHTGIAVSDAMRAAKDRPAESAALRSRMAALQSTHDSAQALHRDGFAPTPEMHQRIESQIKSVIQEAFLIGQLAAQPDLLSDVYNRHPVSHASGNPLDDIFTPDRQLPRPGIPGFDLFCLTSPSHVSQFRRDPKARSAMEFLWKHDPNPDATLTIQESILAAADRGDISDRQNGKAACYYCCPWAAIYLVVRPVTLAGHYLRPGQEFVFDVSAEEAERGGPFRRELLIGRFSSTTKTDYCTGGEDDD